MEDGKAARDPQSRSNELEERLIDFAVRIIKLTANLPRTSAGKHVAGHLMRSGTSPAPNYGEARGAESHADFVHKMRIVLKELNETTIWLRIIERSQLLRKDLVGDIIEENRALQNLHCLIEDCKLWSEASKSGFPMTNEKYEMRYGKSF